MQTNKKISQFAVLLTAALVTVGASAAQMLQKLGPNEGEVDIIAWPGYVERGANDPKFDWVTKFEKETGCKVKVKTANTSDEMVTLMNQGGFDLATASGDASLRLIAGKKVQPINIKLIHDWDKIDDRLKNAPWHTVNGVHYGVPYVWGPNVLMYNTKVFPTTPKSWDVIFKEMTLPDGKSNKGRIEAYNGPIYIADAALYLMAHDKQLGIKNPYELNETQYKAVLDLLRQQNKLIFKYWSDSAVQMDDFKSEGVVASSGWPYQANLLKSEDEPVAYTVPEEGATGWADTLMMQAEAPHPNCSYAWLEHSLNSNLQSDVSVWFGAVPSVPAACSDHSGHQTPEGCIANGSETFNKIWFWRTPISKCETQGNCVPYHRWVSDFIGILGGH